MGKYQNVTIIEGFLSKDAEKRQTKSGKTVATSSVCWNKFVKDADSDKGYKSVPNFFDIEAWGKTADVLGNMKKGQGVCIIGQIEQNTWEVDGTKHSKVKIVCNTVAAKDYKTSESGEPVEPAEEQDPIPFDDVAF